MKKNDFDFVFCSQCKNVGAEIYKNVFLCKLLINSPYGNFSIQCSFFDRKKPFTVKGSKRV